MSELLERWSIELQLGTKAHGQSCRRGCLCGKFRHHAITEPTPISMTHSSHPKTSTVEQTTHWQRASKRLWIAMLVRYLGATLVISPSLCSLALLVAAPFPAMQSLFQMLLVPLVVLANLAAMLWATRQALLKTYPEGSFRLVQDAVPASASERGQTSEPATVSHFNHQASQ
ncbi:hypothetical protein P3G55_26240 [Leptospira sp. 96542]|nr:hypothetical protein [Leptospira sp. 96542]